MSDRRIRMIEDRHLRNSARALVEADIAHLKADLAERSIGARAADRIAEGASEVYDEAIEVAGDNKGALAAIVAALVLWFARNPIIDALFGSDAEERDDDNHGEDHFDEHHEDDRYEYASERDSRWRR